jgi:hypothetical protein
MVFDAQQQLWFPEPEFEDETPRRLGEQADSWLGRSTLQHVRATRRFLNESLGLLPATSRAAFVNAIRHRWLSAFFELVVARTLLALGGDLEVEPESQAVSQIDFEAQFSDGSISVEAIAPVFDREAVEQERNYGPLVAIIEAAAPPGWSVLIYELPDIGPAESKREFRHKVRRLLTIPPPEADAEPVDLEGRVPQGLIYLHLLPKRYGERAVVAEPGGGALDDSGARIRAAIKKKRRQARGAATPALVAIYGSGMMTDYDAFDRAIFGQSVAVFNQHARLERVYFKPDGVFAQSAGSPPTFAGVLAYLRVGFFASPDPILYIHPRYGDSLPEGLSDLERRSFDASRNEITRCPARRSGVLKSILEGP